MDCNKQMALVDLEELERLEREATDAPWESCTGTILWAGDDVIVIKEDSDLIVAMRNALPALLERAREAERLGRELVHAWRCMNRLCQRCEDMRPLINKLDRALAGSPEAKDE